MYREILEILRCPKCNEELALITEKEENSEIIEGNLSCRRGHNWVISEGVINFGAEEQELTNNWTESYEQYDYEEMDKKILEGTPENQRIINDKAKKFIIQYINNKENKFILDIATGRGMLFTEIVKQLKGEAQIICTDLSFLVLKYDRLKAKKINPEVKVNYIACDATNLPFKDNTIDTAVSFFGIANMLDLTADGIEEAERVIKVGKSLLDTYIVIKENSEGFKKIKEICKENKINRAEEFTLKTVIEKAHIEACFEKVNIITIGESIGEKCDFDLLPVEGEWFGIVVAECIK